MRIGPTHFAVAAIACLPCLATAQHSNSTSYDDLGYLTVLTEQSNWPSPQAVAADLRSDDDATRLKALHLLGLTDRQSYALTWKDSTHTERHVVKPDQIEMTYAALGKNATQQAVIAVQIVDLQLTVAAVAIPEAAGWRQIALFSCWCKYDMPIGADALSLFVSFQRALESPPQVPWHFELVLHGSGGGTGIYRQSEAHYRMRGGSLVRVLSFESHTRHCDAGVPQPWFCEIEKRWFIPGWYGAHRNEPGGVLVEAKARIPETDFDSTVIPEIGEARSVQRLTCTPYRWNETVFRFEKRQFLPGEDNPCLRRNPAPH
jgi:hypothetical protein